MIRILAAMLMLAGCSAASSLPDHPLVGVWEGKTALTLKTAEYQHGPDSGQWTAGSAELRYKTATGQKGRCDYVLTGRVLVISDCRLAGRYTRAQ